MKIAIIGAGNIGGTLGRLLAAAGHSIVFGVRRPAEAAALAKEIGAKATVHTVAEAATSGEVVIFAAPYGAWPEFAKAHGPALRGKTLMDAANPYAERDGAIVELVAQAGRGSAAYTQFLSPDAHLVKIFNTMYWLDLRDKAHQAGERLAMPLVGEDSNSVKIATRLANDAGFDPVLLGGFERGKDLDPGSPIYAKSMTAGAVRRALHLT